MGSRHHDAIDMVTRPDNIRWVSEARPLDSSLLWSGIVELVLPGADEAGLHPLVGPQPVDHGGQLRGHHAFLRGASQREQLACIVLQTQHLRLRSIWGMTTPILCQVLGGFAWGWGGGVWHTARTASPKSIFNHPMALMMAIMDWMVLLYTTTLYCLHSSSE